MKTTIQFGLLLALVLGCAQAALLTSMKQAHARAALQSYLDDQLVGAGVFSKAIIFNKEGVALASSPAGFRLLDGEAAAIAHLFSNPSHARASLLTIGGDKYKTVKADDSAIYGKLADIYGKLGDKSVATVKANDLVAVGLNDHDGLSPFDPHDFSSSFNVLSGFLGLSLAH